jgi:hypothetical protein
VGPGRTGSQGDCHQQQRTQGRQRLAHGGLGVVQEACQRLWGALPACTMWTMEVTIIERAPWLWPRPSSSEARTRSAAEGACWGVAAGITAGRSGTDN